MMCFGKGFAEEMKALPITNLAHLVRGWPVSLLFLPRPGIDRLDREAPSCLQIDFVYIPVIDHEEVGSALRAIGIFFLSPNIQSGW